MRPRIFSFIVCSLLFAGICHEAEAQDLGSKEESPIDVSGFDVVPTDPYRLTYRIRPMSILLFPITQGRLGSFNSRLDYAFHRRVSVGIELNKASLQWPSLCQNPNTLSYSVKHSIHVSVSFPTHECLFVCVLDGCLN